MVVQAMRWEFLVDFLRKHILKVFAPVGKDGLLGFGFLSNLGGDSDFSDVFSG